MSDKVDIKVNIGGTEYTLCGYESEGYLQKVATYINGKIKEYEKIDSFKRLPRDKQSILLQLNIADDFFKSKTQINTLEEDLDVKDKEMYALKHELIATQIKLESADKNYKEVQKENIEFAKKIVELETKLKIK